MQQRDFKQVLARLATIRAADLSQAHAVSANQAVPFVTISRQAGAGGRSVARLLAERLNEADPGAQPWTVWDDELVDRVAAEHQIPPAKVSAMEDQRPSWLDAALAGLSAGELPDEWKVFHRVAETIRDLAAMGRVIIVGRGGGFITEDMPGGIHVRLVAPLAHRIAITAHRLHDNQKAATAEVTEKDRNRDAFYRRHWPGRSHDPEHFGVTFNTKAIPYDQVAACIAALVKVAR